MSYKDVIFTDGSDSSKKLLGQTRASNVFRADGQNVDVALNNMEVDVNNAISIAKGASKAYVFDTYDDLTTWLADDEHKAELEVGYQFFVKDTNVPDYWWTGTDISPLETEKVNLDNYYNRTQTDSLLNQKASTGEVAALNTNLRAEIAKKQNTLTAGQNITIENDVISSTAAGDVTKAYLEEHYYDKPFFKDIETLVENDSPSVYSFVEESDISYYAIASYCGKWLDGRDRKHRVYVVTSGIGKGNTVRIADKPSDMDLLISLSATVVGAAAAKNVMTNSDILTYVNDEGIFAVNNFTGYADRMYIFMEYVVKGA